jgi:polar amino acid transport system permease protein
VSVVLASLPEMLRATVLAVEIAALGIVASWIAGLAAALAKDSPWRLARAPAELFIWFTRGAPPLIQVLLIYFGIRQVGIGLTPFAAGVVALGASSGGFVAEIFRSGLKSIPKGQWESSLAIGMGTPHAFRRIILPQVVRVVIPALSGEAINTLKNTSLLSAITVSELTLLTQGLVASTFRPFTFYMTAALIYLALTTLITLAVGWYERRYRLYI